MENLYVNMDEYLPLRDVVFATLRQAILRGELKPGERLMEIHLANRLGVSRTPIREAIRKLELEGLVIMIPRRGAEVAKITEKSLKDVLEVRRALDALSVELACVRITRDAIEELREAMEECGEAMKTGDAAVIAKADVRFHDIIIAAAGNERLTSLINNLAEQMYRYRFEYIKDATNHDKIMEEHRAIYESIAAKNAQQAARAVTRHIDSQEQSIVDMLRLED